MSVLLPRDVQDTHDDLRKLVEIEMGTQLPPEIAKDIKHHVIKLNLDIEKLQRINERISKTKSAIDTLEGPDLTRFPPGIRPFATGYDHVLLDTVVNEESTHTIKIPAGVTIREAKTRLYREYQVLNQKMELNFLSLIRDQLRSITKRSTFIASCSALRKRQTDAWNKLDLDLDPDEMDVVGLSDSNFQAKLCALYKKAINQAALKAMAAEKAADSKTKAKQDLIEALVAKSPGDRLNDAIDQRLAAWKTRGAKQNNPSSSSKEWDVDHAALACSTNIPEKVEACIEEKSVPKNGRPSVRSGSKGQSKGSAGKGKGKAKGKGNGKGTMQSGKPIFPKGSPKGNPKPKGKGKTSQTKAKGKSKGKNSPHGKKGAGKGQTHGGKSSGAGKGRWSSKN